MVRINPVRRLAMILKSFSPDLPILGVSELAARLGLAKSVIHGDLVTLGEEGILEKDGKTGKYFVGSRIFYLGQLAYKQMTLRQCGFPVMEKLSKMIEETVILAGWAAGVPCCIERINSRQSLNVSVDVGARYPLHAGTTGKILLSFLPDEERERMIEGLEFVRYTENTIMDIYSLRRRLNKIREKGYDVSLDERVKGTASVGAPVRDHMGRVIAVLLIGGPTIRFNKRRISEYVSLVEKGAQEISEKMVFFCNSGGEKIFST